MGPAEYRFLSGQNPYVLFLILILLIMGTEKELESYFESARDFILGTKRSVENIRAGIEGMQTNMLSFGTQLLDLQKK
ncbi:hypothetical protein [Desulforamulus aquiferis]|uniref:Uncharacterized protein n=1 Tax=Desulforamulus aquiferis TaxID=1397668 RepID=A0AAW7ZAJ7_9FIRM|nr:hypothetical protein [Desulforamulus aquiferis]MDO7786430.1 hypothetical protein [Desulforamulus aquiferis]